MDLSKMRSQYNFIQKVQKTMRERYPNFKGEMFDTFYSFRKMNKIHGPGTTDVFFRMYVEIGKTMGLTYDG